MTAKIGKKGRKGR